MTDKHRFTLKLTKNVKEIPMSTYEEKEWIGKPYQPTPAHVVYIPTCPVCHDAPFYVTHAELDLAEGFICCDNCGTELQPQDDPYDDTNPAV